MTVEDALTDLADRPIRQSPFSSVLLAVLNSHLPGERPVDSEMTGQQVLTKVYSLPDTQVQERLMSRTVGIVRNRDSYRTALLLFAGIIGTIGITLGIAEVVSAGSPEHKTGIEVLSRIVDGSFEILGAMLGVK